MRMTLEIMQTTLCADCLSSSKLSLEKANLTDIKSAEPSKKPAAWLLINRTAKTEFSFQNLTSVRLGFKKNEN